LKNEIIRARIVNAKFLNELQKAKSAEKTQNERFCRDFFGNLDHLMVTREHNKNVEKKKDKLIEDIIVKAVENQWKQCRGNKQKQDLLNKTARLCQFDEMKWRKKGKIEEMIRQRQENEIVNKQEMMERCHMKQEAESFEKSSICLRAFGRTYIGRVEKFGRRTEARRVVNANCSRT
jgi:hypothetical protein